MIKEFSENNVKTDVIISDSSLRIYSKKVESEELIVKNNGKSNVENNVTNIIVKDKVEDSE